MNNFTLRTISGAVYVSLVIACLLTGTWMSFILFFIFNILALWEYSGLTLKNYSLQHKIIFIISGVLIFSITALWQFMFITPKVLGILLVLAVLPFINELFFKNQNPFDVIGKQLTGLIYISLSLSLMFGLGYKRLVLKDGNLVYNGMLVLSVFILIWVNDTFAYLVGKWKGKRPLLSRISPKKTIEGSIGGLIFTVAVSIGLYFWFTQFMIYQYAILGVLISISAIAGDLVESMLKRSLEVKDSGKLIPGHGGILDRIDAVLITAWVVFIYFQLI